jgi:hypothetical protein
MSKLDREALSVRYKTNMRRIAGVVKLLHSDIDGLKPIGLLRSEGVRADILRLVAVFLHTALEDFVRSHFSRPNKNMGFYSASDFETTLRRLNIDPALFTDLFPPLIQLARRRVQIVHRADLDDVQSDKANPWVVSDEWQLIHWNLAAIAFYYRIRKATGPTGMVENRASQNVENALVQNVEFARALVGFTKLPAEQRREGLIEIGKMLEKLQATLKLEVEMFLGPDGKPIGRAV